jgi:hypothetical protein
LYIFGIGAYPKSDEYLILVHSDPVCLLFHMKLILALTDILRDDHHNILVLDLDLYHVRFEVFAAVTMKNGILWDVTPYDSCKKRSVRRLLVTAKLFLVRQFLSP